MRKLLSYICLLALLLSGCGARDKAPEPGEEGPGALSRETWVTVSARTWVTLSLFFGSPASV